MKPWVQISIAHALMLVLVPILLAAMVLSTGPRSIGQERMAIFVAIPFGVFSVLVSWFAFLSRAHSKEEARASLRARPDEKTSA